MDAAAVAAAAKPPAVSAPGEAPKVIQSADERLTAVVEFHTYRLRDGRAMYAIKQALKMRRTAKDVKPYFGAESYFSGKTPLKDSLGAI